MKVSSLASIELASLKERRKKEGEKSIFDGVWFSTVLQSKRVDFFLNLHAKLFSPI